MLNRVFSSNFIEFATFVRSIVLIIILFSLSAFASAFAIDDVQNVNPQNTKKLLKKAKKLYRKGRNREAEKILRQIIARKPQHRKAKLDLAYILVKEKRLLESYNIAVDLAKKDSKDSYAFAILGTTLLSAGNFKQARIFLNNSLALNKREALAWGSLGQLNFYENLVNRSLKDLRNAVYQDPKEADFIFSLAQVAARTENYKESADAYEKFLEIAPNSDSERKDRIKGLIKFLRYLGKKATLYTLGGEKETSVPMELVDNRPVIKIKLKKNGPSLRFVLDTGSGMTVISQETAKKLHINSITKGGKARALGGDGKFNIIYGFLNTVRIGDVKIKNVPIYIRKFYNKTNKVDGYIGLSVISKYITTIDYGNKTFSLVKKSLYNKRPVIQNNDSMTFPLRLTSSGFLSGLVKLEGIDSPLNFIVDTGASVSVISEEIANSKELKNYILEQKMNVIGAAGITEGVSIFSLPNVSLGRFSSKDLTAIALNLNMINEASGYEQAGILGGNFLKDYSLTFDFEKSKVTFVPIKN